MEVQNKTTLTFLNKNSVSVLEQQFIDLDGELIQIDEDWRCAFINSPKGRQSMIDYLDKEHSDVVLAVWGDTPTLEDLPVGAIDEEETSAVENTIVSNQNESTVIDDSIVESQEDNKTLE